MKNTLIGKLSYILSKKQKITLIFIFIGILISSFLELLGVSSILPIVNMITDPTSSDTSWYIKIIEQIFHTTGDATIVVLCIIMMILFIIKGAYLLLMNYLMTMYLKKIQIHIATTLVETYLAMPFEFHLENNSATLLRSATTDVTNFNTMMSAILNLVLKIVISLVIIIFLFVFNPLVTLIVAGVLGIVLVLILFVFKPKIRKIGRETKQLNALNIKALNQAFNGVKESKIANAEKYFSDIFKTNQAEINSLALKNTIFNEVPSIALEMFGMVSLLGALLIVIACGYKGTIVSQFSIFALATIKLLPYITNISMNFNTLFVTKASVDLIFDDITKATKLEEVVKNQNMNYQTMEFNSDIVASDVSFKYKGSDKLVLNNVSAVIHKGEFVAFSGASGAGKTTFIDLLLGLLKPTEGIIKCDGVDVSKNPRGWHENLSYIPQSIFLMDDTIRSNVTFGIPKEKIDEQKVWAALEKAQLKTFVESLPNKLDTIVGERGVRLSGGQRQRIGIARALYRNTQILIFDEATSALDYETEAAIIKCINGFKGEHTMIMITHRLNTIEACDHIYEIANGKMGLKR